MSEATVQATYRRYWRCEVSSSGYHNGCHCSPDDPHGGWNCGYAWIAPVLSDAEIQRMTAKATPTPQQALQAAFDRRF